MSGEVIERRPSVRAPAAKAFTSLSAVARAHAGLLAVIGGGLVLRVLALVAIYPGIWFSDTNSFVDVAATGVLDRMRASAYSLLVWPFYRAGSAGALIVTQHLIGLAIVVVLYALLVRRGVPKWLATLAVVPPALDAYLINVEHAIMSDTLFDACVVVAAALLLWGERPRARTVAVAGLVLGFAVVVRSVGLPFVVVFFVYVLVRRLGPARVAAFVAGCAVFPLAYAAVFDAQHGSFALTQSGGKFLAARVAPIANCRDLHGLPRRERKLCPHRGVTTTGYLWGHHAPVKQFPDSQDGLIRDFALRVIRDRPGAYAQIVAEGVLHYFEPGHRIGSNDYPDAPWQFPVDPTKAGYPGYRGPIRPGRAHRKKYINPNQYITRMAGHPHTDTAASKVLAQYQRYGYTSGQLLGLCVLLVVAALVARRGAWRLRLDAALLAAATLAALLMAVAVSVFSYRYGLIAIVLLPAAGALAVTALREERRTESA